MSRNEIERNSRIYDLHKQGKSIREIAAIYSRHWTTIHKIIQRVAWENRPKKVIHRRSL